MYLTDSQTNMSEYNSTYRLCHSTLQVSRDFISSNSVYSLFFSTSSYLSVSKGTASPMAQLVKCSITYQKVQKPLDISIWSLPAKSLIYQPPISALQKRKFTHWWIIPSATRSCQNLKTSLYSSHFTFLHIKIFWHYS